MTAFEPPAADTVEDRRPAGGGTDGEPAAGSPLSGALARLDGVQQLPLHEQPDVYQTVHAELQNALAAIDDA